MEKIKKEIETATCPYHPDLKEEIKIIQDGIHAFNNWKTLDEDRQKRLEQQQKETTEQLQKLNTQMTEMKVSTSENYTTKKEFSDYKDYAEGQFSEIRYRIDKTKRNGNHDNGNRLAYERTSMEYNRLITHGIDIIKILTAAVLTLAGAKFIF